METEANKIIKQPSYRFAGYTESWEDKKLGEIVERITRKNKNLESELPLTISAQHGLINQETFFNKKVASKDVSGYYLLKKGEFAYNKSYSSDYPWGAVKRLENYEMGVLSTLYIVFRPNSIDSDFLAVYYDSPKWYKEVSMRAAEGARNHGLLNISPQDFFDTELIFPVNQSEQTAIGSFFQDIDQLISLQQRKLEVLKEQKKTYLKLLFPAKGQTKPDLRFAGFEDDWKEVKLGEVFDIVTDYVANGSFESLRNNVKTYEKDNFAYMIRLQDASNSWRGPWLYTDEKGYNFLSKSRLFKDDILMSNVGTVGRFFQVPELDRPMTLAPNSVLIRSTSSNNQFLYFMMLTPNIQDQITMRKTPGVQDKINKTDFKKVIATLPSLPEQEVIGSFFQDLDKAIAKQEEKVNQLKESKQTFLKKMFI